MEEQSNDNSNYFPFGNVFSLSMQLTMDLQTKWIIMISRKSEPNEEGIHFLLDWNWILNRLLFEILYILFILNISTVSFLMENIQRNWNLISVAWLKPTGLSNTMKVLFNVIGPMETKSINEKYCWIFGLKVIYL